MKQPLKLVCLFAMMALLGAQGVPADALIVAPELQEARMKYVRKLGDSQKYREQLRELLELRAEVPRRQGLAIDYSLGLCYRAIADAICEGLMGENDRGELVYYTEVPGYEAWGTNRVRMADLVPVTNLGRPVTNLLKRTRQVPVVLGPDFITNTTPYFVYVTNTVQDTVITSNEARAELVSTNIDIRETVTTNRFTGTRELTLTNWQYLTNVSTTPVERVTTNTAELLVTNFSFLTNITTKSIVQVTSNIMILTNKTLVTNKNKSRVAEDLSFENQAYEFYPGSFSGLKVLRSLQVQTNLNLQTTIRATTNTYVVTNLVVTTNQRVERLSVGRAITNTEYLTNLTVTTNLSTEKKTVTGDENVTYVTNRQEIPREVRSTSNYWVFQTNQVARAVVTSNEALATNVVPGPGTRYQTVEETTPVITYPFQSVELPRPEKRRRGLTPVALKYYDLAIRWFNRLAANGFENPYQESALLRKGEVYRDIEQPTLAVEVFSQFQRTFPRCRQVLSAMVERANAYVTLGRIEDAQTVVVEALEVFPDSDQKEFLLLKLDYLRSLGAEKRPGLQTAPRNELERKARQLEAFELEMRKKELRLRELEKPVRP